jgi:hypothetical protein
MFLFRNAPGRYGLEDKDMRSLPLQQPQPASFPGLQHGHAPDQDMRFTGTGIELVSSIQCRSMKHFIQLKICRA